MSYTSAQSGDNYRNWWPHRTMTAFTEDSIDLMARLAADSKDIFTMKQRGYALATRRKQVPDLLGALQPGLDVRVLSGQADINKTFPAFSPDIANVVQIGKAGDFSSQQLGQYMLEKLRDAGGGLYQGEVTGIAHEDRFVLDVATGAGRRTVRADIVVNAAGPFVRHVAAMLGEDLPTRNIYQQKIVFEDVEAAVPRDMPFSIDLDEKTLGWNEEEQELLAGDPELAWLSDALPGGTHCRPEGGARSRWVKLGWAYNETASEPQKDLGNEPNKDPQFPEIVIRGAAALIPALAPYIETPPTRFTHYGGYYTMTDENWPLIGPMATDGSYVVGALSGFGSMSACAAGRLCAAWISGGELPGYAADLSPARYDDSHFIKELQQSADKGLL